MSSPSNQPSASPIQEPIEGQYEHDPTNPTIQDIQIPTSEDDSPQGSSTDPIQNEFFKIQRLMYLVDTKFDKKVREIRASLEREKKLINDKYAKMVQDLHRSSEKTSDSSSSVGALAALELGFFAIVVSRIAKFVKLSGSFNFVCGFLCRMTLYSTKPESRSGSAMHKRCGVEVSWMIIVISLRVLCKDEVLPRVSKEEGSQLGLVRMFSFESMDCPSKKLKDLLMWLHEEEKGFKVLCLIEVGGKIL
ncbi:hypothetical protein M5K25_026802 [Dendrobium thyrsiflorum]|uniref:Uncharacterized protein n=1 Tax=Dendrobium thyrsiflorum TaxID=117978 RepID=A0ABD0TY61_DENTH